MISCVKHSAVQPILAFLALVSLIPAAALPQPQAPMGGPLKPLQVASQSHVHPPPISSAAPATITPSSKLSAAPGGDLKPVQGAPHSHVHPPPIPPPGPPMDGGNETLFVQGGFPNSTTCTNPKIRKEWCCLSCA